MEQQKDETIKEEYIQVYIIIQLDGSPMFDYNNYQAQEQKQYRALTYKLPIPSKQTYYFFHQHLSSKQIIFLQNRSALRSHMEIQKAKITDFMLMGGIKLFYKADRLHMRILSATDIPTTTVFGDFQPLEEQVPYLIIRTFKEKGYPIKQFQTLKLGKILLDLEDLALDSNIGEAFQQKAITLNVSEIDKAGEQQIPSCRVCYQGENNEDTLVNPCDCKGSNKYIHISCLKQWVSMKLKKMNKEGNGQIYYLQNMFCQVCKKPFPSIIYKAGKRYTILDFIEETQPFIAVKTRYTSFNLNNLEERFYIQVDKQNKATIGRFLGNAVIFQEQTVSKFHCQIFIKQSLQKGKKYFFVRDLKSKYGTLLYDDEMEIKLSHCDRAFQIKNTVFSLKLVKRQSVSTNASTIL